MSRFRIEKHNFTKINIIWLVTRNRQLTLKFASLFTNMQLLHTVHKAHAIWLKQKLCWLFMSLISLFQQSGSEGVITLPGRLLSLITMAGEAVTSVFVILTSLLTSSQPLFSRSHAQPDVDLSRPPELHLHHQSNLSIPLGNKYKSHSPLSSLCNLRMQKFFIRWTFLNRPQLVSGYFRRLSTTTLQCDQRGEQGRVLDQTLRLSDPH